MARAFAWLLNMVYAMLLIAAAPWIAWSAVRHGKHREGFGQKLLGLAPRRAGDRPCLWLHAVSVGEVNLLATILAEISARSPESEIVISTTTKAGFDLARRKYADRTVFYCPLDFTWAVGNAMRRVRPTVLVLAELELWPNLISAAKRHGAKVAVINGRLSDNSFRGYHRVRALVGHVLRQVDLIAAQNLETAERFIALGARLASVHVTGSLKFDGAQSDRGNPRTAELRELAGIASDDIVFLAGSTQEPEEQYALEILQRLATSHPRVRVILVPRHPHRFDEVAELVARSGLPWHRRSELSPELVDPSGRAGQGRWRVLLVDTIGELGAWWGAAQIGFVGGSFGDRGGQNMLEPAAYGVATCFGPNTWNFRDIVAQLLAADGARVVLDAAELEAFVRWAIESPAEAAALGSRANQLVRSQQGATARTCDLLLRLVETPRRLENVRAA
jgi:3-deoxy-D-manno-octulosonic-acid transferase